ncbi:MAG: GAF domain-containing protein [Sodaliphilus sp.]
MVNKDAIYIDVVRYISELITADTLPAGVLCNVMAVLHDALPHYFWVGVYLVRAERLELGPFQGPPACFYIQKGKGVCGTAWAEARTIVVPDVEQFAGHIACSSLSKSEIVVPVMRDGEVVAVIDVDSQALNAFDDTDQHHLEHIAAMLSETGLL